MKTNYSRTVLAWLVATLLFTACGGGGVSPPAGGGTTSYTISGSTSGLIGTITLQDNSGDDLTVSTNGSFTFSHKVTSGSPYSVTVLTQPVGQTCSVSTGTGTVSGSNVTNVAVVCATDTYNLGGAVSGLIGSIVLQDNGGDNLTVVANGTFTFATKVANGSPYSVTVLTQPVGQTCSVSTGTGTVSGSSVTNVALVCTTNAYSVGGTLTGLSAGNSITLTNNATDNLILNSNGAFTFVTQLDNVAAYSLTLSATTPTAQPCTSTFGAGTINAANINSMNVFCGRPGGLGTFTSTGTLTTGHNYRHSSTLLPNGKVLVAGGEAPNNILGSGILASAELYDPDTGTWTATGSLATGRSGHTATLLPNGKVLVSGGTDSSGNSLSSAELYDLATGTWSATGSLVMGRTIHTATLLANGKVLVSGGFNPTDNTLRYALSFCELYDPATRTWTATGSMSTKREGHAATLLPNGKVLVSGGEPSTFEGNVASVDLYDPASGTWTVTAALSTPRGGHSSTLLPNGKVLVSGGIDNYGHVLPSADLYDPATETWAATGLMTTERYVHTATLLPTGQVLVSGGTSQYVNALASAELYDPNAGTWTSTGSLPLGVYGHKATLLANGKVLISGSLTLLANDAEIYY